MDAKTAKKHLGRAKALLSGRGRSPVGGEASKVGLSAGAVPLSTLPVPELLIGLFLVVLSHLLKVGEDYSLGRAAILLFFCGLIGAYGIARNPYAPFLVYAFVTPILPNFGVGLALVLGGTVSVLAHRAKLQWKWSFSWAGSAFCLWALVSLTWADRLQFDQSGFLAQTLPAMVLAIAVSGIRHSLFIRNLALLVISACVLGSLCSLRNWSQGIVEFSGGYRVYSFIRPDIFSAWEIFGLMCALAWLLTTRAPVWSRGMMGGGVGLILLGIGLSGYRAAIVASAVGVLVVGVCQKQILRGLAFIGLIGAVASCFYVIKPAMFEPVISRFQTITEDRGSERLDLWQDAFVLFRQSPILGIGCDNFRSQIGIMPHSIYIGTLVELGAVGFGLLLCWIGMLFYKAWRAADRMWVLPLLAAYLVQAAFLHEFYFSCFWLALGLVEGGRPQAAAASRTQTAVFQRAPVRLDSVARRLNGWRVTLRSSAARRFRHHTANWRER